MRGREEEEQEEKEEARSLKTDDRAAFKQLYVSSASQKTPKEMFESGPRRILKKPAGPDSVFLSLAPRVVLSPFLFLSPTLSQAAIYPDYIRGQSLICTLGVPVLTAATMGCLFGGCYSSGKLHCSAREPGPGHMKASHLFDKL